MLPGFLELSLAVFLPPANRRPMERKSSDPEAIDTTKTRLLSSSTASSNAPPLPPQEKGRCWCCWETTETPSNPLVRVCLGCRDPDLQWIHQTCVDSYITALPSSPSLPGGGQVAAVEGEPLLWNNNFLNNNFMNNTANNNSNNNNMANEPEKRVFKCTRCGDVYTVIERELPRIPFILTDPHMRAALLIMIVCMIVINLCSISILRDSWRSSGSNGSNNGGGGPKLDLGPLAVRVNSGLFCSFILVVSWWFAIETCWMIWAHAGGRMDRKVVPVGVVGHL